MRIASVRQWGLSLAVAVALTAAAMLPRVAGAAPPAQADSAENLPNIVFILADDLGYGDLGCYGQTKIRTPNLDQLAAEGMRFTRHYSGNAVCAPSRCVLMTGLHPGHAYIRDNREAKPEGQTPIPAATLTLAEILQSHGYVTGGFGKWGLGSPGSEGRPLAQGFNRFFGYNCQRVAHNFYPTYLWDNDERVMLNNPDFPAHDKLKPADDPALPGSYARFRGRDYAPDSINEQAMSFVRANQDRPFFLYWPTTVPHLGLQVPEDSLAEYAGRWDDPPYLGNKGYVPNFAPRATYAAMVTRMDRDIGRLMQLLTELGLEKRTILVFSSDNGPLYDQTGGTDCEFFNSHGGLRGRKGSLYEGGFRVPCIVRWPDHVAAGGQSDRVSGFEDWLPTLLELIGLDRTPAGLDGISFAPTLLGNPQEPRPFLYREFPGYGGQQCLIAGPWKAVRQNLNKLPQGKQPKTELYNLNQDPTETQDLAAQEPATLQQLEQRMAAEHSPSREFPLRGIDP